MTLVIRLVTNLIALAIIAWISIVFYFAYENYRSGEDFCINSKVLEDTGEVFNSAYKWTKGEAFEDKDLVPYDLNVEDYTPLERPAFTPEYSTDNDDENYNDVLLSQLEPSIIEQHAEYAADSNHTTRGASMQMEKSNVDDIVPQWGLRRIKYGADILSKNATTVPSFEYTGETKKTNLNNLIS